MVTRMEKNCIYRPCLVLSYVDSAQAALAGRLFRRQGWEVHLASTGSETYQLTRATSPQVAVLDISLPDESGWLTCAKVRLENPSLKLILLADRRDEETLQRASIVGASAVITRSEGVSGLLNEVLGRRLAQAI